LNDGIERTGRPGHRKVNIDQIKEALNEKAEQFARWLSPAGRRQGDSWIVGSLRGEAGKLLSQPGQGKGMRLFNLRGILAFIGGCAKL
jgi:hypothetical protein